MTRAPPRHNHSPRQIHTAGAATTPPVVTLIAGDPGAQEVSTSACDNSSACNGTAFAAWRAHYTQEVHAHTAASGSDSLLALVSKIARSAFPPQRCRLHHTNAPINTSSATRITPSAMATEEPTPRPSSACVGGGPTAPGPCPAAPRSLLSDDPGGESASPPAVIRALFPADALAG